MSPEIQLKCGYPCQPDIVGGEPDPLVYQARELLGQPNGEAVTYWLEHGDPPVGWREYSSYCEGRAVDREKIIVTKLMSLTSALSADNQDDQSHEEAWAYVLAGLEEKASLSQVSSLSPRQALTAYLSWIRTRVWGERNQIADSLARTWGFVNRQRLLKEIFRLEEQLDRFTGDWDEDQIQAGLVRLSLPWWQQKQTEVIAAKLPNPGNLEAEIGRQHNAWRQRGLRSLIYLLKELPDSSLPLLWAAWEIQLRSVRAKETTVYQDGLIFADPSLPLLWTLRNLAGETTNQLATETHRSEEEIIGWIGRSLIVMTEVRSRWFLDGRDPVRISADLSLSRDLGGDQVLVLVNDDSQTTARFNFDPALNCLPIELTIPSEAGELLARLLREGEVIIADDQVWQIELLKQVLGRAGLTGLLSYKLVKGDFNLFSRYYSLKPLPLATLMELLRR